MQFESYVICVTKVVASPNRLPEGLTMRRTVIKVRAAAALVGAGLIMSLMWLPTAGATTQMTATVGVNIRAGAGTQTSVLGGLYRGQTVTAISSSTGWTKIKFADSTAYVADRKSVV